MGQANVYLGIGPKPNHAAIATDNAAPTMWDGKMWDDRGDGLAVFSPEESDSETDTKIKEPAGAR